MPAVLSGGPEYRDAILWHQSTGRLTASFAHAQPRWFFLALLPLLGFPLFWSQGLWRSLLARWAADRGLRLCAIWFGAALALFSMTSGKQIHYLVPELPALALIAARVTLRRPGFALLPAIAMLCLVGLSAGLLAAGVISAGNMTPMLVPGLSLPLSIAVIALASIVTGQQNCDFWDYPG